MPPKRKAQVDSDAGSSGPPPTFRRKGARKSGPARTQEPVAAVDEYDEDPGRQESRTFQEWGGWHQRRRAAEEERTNKFLKDFEEEIYTAQNGIFGELQISEDGMLKADGGFADQVTQCLEDGDTDTCKKTQPLHVAQKQLLRTCHRILEAHKTVEEVTRGQPLSSHGPRWKQDEDEMKMLIQYGRKVADEVTQCIVLSNQDSSAIRNVDEDKLNDMGKMAVELLQTSRHNLGKGTWSGAARSQVAALSTLAKTVPDGQ